MPTESEPFNPAHYLTTPAAVQRFLNDALQTKDVSFIASAFGIVAESAGVEEIARQTGLNCEQRCLAVSEQSEPTLAALVAALDALQFTLSIETHNH